MDEPFDSFSNMNVTVTCSRYYSKNSTKVIQIETGYNGIPENLLINVIVFLVLVLLFTILRKLAWDYGRIALVHRNQERLPLGDSRYNVWTSLFYGDHDDKSVNAAIGSTLSLDQHIDAHDRGICSWIPAFFRVKDAHILRKCGQDAVQYLSFQRYLLVYLAIVCVLSIAVVLPVNFQGDQEGSKQEFGHTTISNVDQNSDTLWVHMILAVVYVCIGVYIMRHFSANLNYEEDEEATRTLMISNVPPEKCFKNSMQQHFSEAYPELEVTDIQFGYNVTELIKLERKRKAATEGRLASEAQYQKEGERPTMVPHKCGRLCCCCQVCGISQRVDAIQQYTQEERDFKNLVDMEKSSSFQRCLGIAFVTFQSESMAQRVYLDFKSACKGTHAAHSSSISQDLQISDWHVDYAPEPENIYWENLSIDVWIWWLKAILINGVLVIALFFLSTPTILISSLDSVDLYKNIVEGLKNSSQKTVSVIGQFMSTLILWACSAILPWIVYYSDQYIGHWTRTAEHHTVMRKTFTFLVIMVVILPSFGLTSVNAFLEYTTSEQSNMKYRWQCIFLPDNGAFFVNYVITSAFIGGGLDLMRFPELFLYFIKTLSARSDAEMASVRRSVLWEFQFGQNYAWMLCNVAVIMAYSIPCPLIVPFGLIYLGMKHIVDRYNIYFAYLPSKINKNIHTSAINFVIVATLLLQGNIFLFSVLRSNIAQSIFCLVTTLIIVVVFMGWICFGWCKNFSPIAYRFLERQREFEMQNIATIETMDGEESAGRRRSTTETKPFVPGVLLEQDKPDLTSQTNDLFADNARQSYGALSNSDLHKSQEAETYEDHGELYNAH